MKRFINRLIQFLPYLIAFIYSLYGPSDPDLGWHLKYGEYFFQHWSPLRDNTFSALMPGYHWANTSWFTDVITYAVFHLFSFAGLSVLGALVVSLTLFIVAKSANLSLWEEVFLFPFLLYLQNPVNEISFRGQQFSLLFVALLFYIISLAKTSRKRLYLLIPLFFVWANLNGEFLFGFGLLGLWMLSEVIIGFIASLKKNHIHASGFMQVIKVCISPILFYGTVLLACILATFVNPFGYGIHLAALSHVGSPLLKYIAEYLPFEQFSQVWFNQVIVGIFIGFGFLYLFFKKHMIHELPKIVVMLFVFILSFGVRRYAWPAYYLLVPLFRPIVSYFKPDGKKATRIMSTIFLFVFLSLAMYAKYPFTQLKNYSWQTYCTSQFVTCSPASAHYLVSHKLTHNVFALYGWGGYLIWNYPQVTPVIDGRMHLWHDGSYSAFADYYGYEQNFKDIDKSVYNIVYMPPDKPIYSRMLALVAQKKWRMVFHDSTAGIFVRTSPNNQ